MNTAGTSIFNL